jgi:RHS repeat-associated protein
MIAKQLGAMPTVAALIASALTWPALSEAQTAIAGFTPGSLSISSSGAAAYRVPIQVPPGVAGMQPQVAFAYNSQAGNGLLGVGWSLQGLSIITRCPRTMAQDGARGSVKYDANDRFCLDGERLMLVSGSYGADGAVYGTEREVFSKVVSYGTAGSGPQHFKVWTKSGQVLEYGNTPDSSIEAQGQASVRVWALNRATDRKGNYLAVAYVDDSASGNYRVARIDYTGNAGTGLAPTASVRFTYASRTDTSTAYQGGFVIKSSHRMTNATTYAGETVVKDYRLAYEYAGATGRSRLTSVTECADPAGASCLSPTVFGWPPEKSGFTTSTPYEMPERMHDYAWLAKPEVRWGQFADVNGDGLVDWVRAYRNPDGASSLRTLLNTGSGWQADSGYALPEEIYDYAWTAVTELARGQFVDVNGDGLPDWVRAYRNPDGDVSYRTLLNTGAGWQADTGYELPERIYDYAWAAKPQITQGQFVDVNGDGLPDWVRAYRNPDSVNSFRTLINTGSGWQASTPYELPEAIYDYAWADKAKLIRGQFVDVNGDGLPDWVRAYRSPSGATSFRTLLNTGSGWQSDSAYEMPEIIYDYAWLAAPEIPRGQFIDVNGDGLVDWVRAYRNPEGSTSFRTLLNTGAGWAADTDYALPEEIYDYSWAEKQLTQGQFLDVNGDGLPDWVRAYISPEGITSLKALLNTGSGWRGDSAYELPEPVYDYSWADKPQITRGQFVDVNGDGVPDWVRAYRKPNGALDYLTRLARSAVPDVLLSIVDSLGAQTQLSYKPLTNKTVYTRDGAGASGTYPIQNLQPPIFVVSSISASNGIGGTVSTSRTYGGFKLELGAAGRGLLGLRWEQAKDDQTGVELRTEYSQTWPYLGLPSLVRKTQSSGATLSEITNSLACINPATGGACTLAAGSRYFPYTGQSVETGADLDGAALPTVTTTTQYDSYGNPTSITVAASDGYARTTTNTYANDSANWLLGRLTRGTVQGTVASETLTRTSGFEYDSVSGLLIREAIEPESSTLCFVSMFGHDAYGNRVSTTTRNCDGTSSGGLTEAPAPPAGSNALFESRAASAIYAAGQFPTTRTNALGHEEAREYDPRFGTVTKLTGPNGLVTAWTYDAFGRRATETRSDGTGTTSTYTLCGACPANGKYFVTDVTTGAPTRTAYFDSLNREIRSELQGFDGTAVRKDTEYDNLGRILRVSQPYYAGAAPVWTNYLYDALGRVIQADEPATSAGSARTVTSYSGLVTTVTVSNAGSGTNMPNGVVQTQTTTRNSQRQVVQVIDAQGSIIGYTFDPFGKLKTTDAGGVVTTLSYDLRGRKLGMTDPDMGTWRYDYNAAGELVWQQDAKLQVATMAYDKLGRMTARVEADLTSKWFYDAYPTTAPEWDASMVSGLAGDCSRGKGKPCYVWADNGYRRAHGYEPDATKAGRLLDTNVRIDGDYIVRATYDSAGRLDTTTYPTGFAVKNVYNAHGYLWKVQRTNDADTTVYWTANTLNAAGQVTQEVLGNGLTTARTYDALYRTSAIQSGAVQNLAYSHDAIGNLVQRIDSVQGVTENFTYDTLNRLLTASGPGLTTRTFGYDPIGNVAHKSDIGAHVYPAVGDARPHAVSSVTNDGAPNSITAAYGYDPNGSQISALGTVYGAASSAAFSRTIAYTSFNMPASLTRTLGAESYSYTYAYNTEHERMRLIAVRPDDTVTSTYLHPGGRGALLYEKETRASDGRIEHKHYVNGGSGLVGVFVTKSSYGAGEGPQMRYFHRDCVGSITRITDPSGAPIEALGYEGYGERRYPSGQEQDRTALPPLAGVSTDRGFTAHEHLDEMNLVHMNGRIFDPALGRFLTADPFVQEPENLQSYNRYSYVLNNPLIHTDPSGYFKLKDLVKVAAVVAASYFTMGTASAAYSSYAYGAFAGDVILPATVASIGQTAALVGGAAGGFAGGVVGGGNLKSGFQGAFGGALFAGVGNLGLGNGTFPSIAAHSGVGCVSSAASGGSCSSGALAAGFSEALVPHIDTGSRLGNAMAHAMAGGTASAIAGGRFEEGAITAAFGYLFNSLQHEIGDPDAPPICHDCQMPDVEKTTLGQMLPFTGDADRAVDFWADMQVRKASALYAIPGTLAAAWTPDNAPWTATSLTFPSTTGLRAIPGGIAAGSRHSVGLFLHNYPRAGGFGLNVYVAPYGRVFAVDYHQLWGRSNLLHYHRGLSEASQKLHRPYQGW